MALKQSLVGNRLLTELLGLILRLLQFVNKSHQSYIRFIIRTQSPIIAKYTYKYTKHETSACIDDDFGAGSIYLWYG